MRTEPKQQKTRYKARPTAGFVFMLTILVMVNDLINYKHFTEVFVCFIIKIKKRQCAVCAKS